MFVNHQFGDLLYSKDAGTRARHANAIKQMSPPRGDQTHRSPQSQTAYEKWWYAQRDEIVKKLEDGDDQQQQQQQQQLQGDEEICKNCQGSIPRSNNGSQPRGLSQSNQQEISPVRRGNSQQQQQSYDNVTNNNLSVNTNNSSAAAGDKNSPSRVPGTEFVALHPSHLYLHHHDVVNHVYEDMVRHPGNTEARRNLEEEAKRSPSRHDPNMTAYEKWWYAERDRILEYVESHKDGPK